ncbi:YSIRK-type signal peptide-containing protein, partial [Staphylococcus aureus]|nr:YSIRK-type signal peptide-containing protein [Staphylococcus aureus]
MNMKKKEKHAIRKKSIGVASVLVGTLIGFGLLSSKEADASENSVTQSDSASNESKSNDSSSVSAAPKTDDTNVSDTKKSSPDSCVKCYTMFLPFLLIKIDVF